MHKHLITYEAFSDEYILEHLLVEGKVEDIHSKFYSDIDLDQFYTLIDLDPTTKKKGEVYKKVGQYSKWILALYRKKEITSEHYDSLPILLSFLDDKKQFLKEKGEEIDIFKHTYQSLLDIYNKYQNTYKPKNIVEDESDVIKNRYYIDNDEAQLYYEDDDFLIVAPKTLDASQFYSQECTWCTIYPESFAFYSKFGALYIVIDKRKLNTNDPNRRLLIQLDDMNQFANLDHESVLDYIIGNKKLFKIFKDKLLKSHPPNKFLKNDIESALKRTAKKA